MAIHTSEAIRALHSGDPSRNERLRQRLKVQSSEVAAAHHQQHAVPLEVGAYRTHDRDGVGDHLQVIADEGLTDALRGNGR